MTLYFKVWYLKRLDQLKRNLRNRQKINILLFKKLLTRLRATTRQNDRHQIYTATLFALGVKKKIISLTNVWMVSMSIEINIILLHYIQLYYSYINCFRFFFTH